MPSLSRSLEAQMPIEGLDCGERGHALLHTHLPWAFITESHIDKIQTNE